VLDGFDVFGVFDGFDGSHFFDVLVLTGSPPKTSSASFCLSNFQLSSMVITAISWSSSFSATLSFAEN